MARKENMEHICTSGCGKDFDCPICPHGKDDQTYCEQCDKPMSQAEIKADRMESEYEAYANGQY